MARENYAVRLRRQLISSITRLAREGRLKEKIDAIPYEITSEGWETIRCCVHHDRALLRLRLLSLLGFSTEGLSDVERPLREYLDQVLAGREVDEFPLSLMTEACNACAKARYVVTDACQGCLARPCKVNCPKGAVSMRDDKAHIDPELCISCGLCEKSCAFHAIIKVPVPCEEACPVGAIQKGPEGIASIDESKCILCGKCLAACPFGAPVEKSEIVRVLAALGAGRRVIALVAPAAMVQFPFPTGQYVAALEHFGFSEVLEVAAAADRVAEKEAEELVHLSVSLTDEGVREGGRSSGATDARVLATSCCPSWVRASASMEMAEYLSSSPSPMVLAGLEAKAQHPDAFTVFIGPCLAKRWEAHRAAQMATRAGSGPGSEVHPIDAVLTSEEVGAMLMAASIQVNEERPKDLARTGGASKYGRGFAATRGVAAAVLHALPGAAARANVRGVPEVSTFVVSGITKETSAMLAQLPEHGGGLLVEVMACEGGCVNGPCAIAGPKAASALLERYKAEAGKS
jgi:[FeFe] hydrogenase (group B1/B3)